MSWVALGAATIAGAAGVGGALIANQGNDEGPALNLPSFFEDPLFGESQELLFGKSKQLLSGEPGEFFSPIGDIGGQEFEDILRLTQRDTERAGLETAARTGARGPGVAAGISRSIADLTKGLRFKGLTRGVEGRKFLLTSGLNTASTVGGRALNNQELRNRFNMQRAGFELDLDQNAFNQEGIENAEIQEMIASAGGAAGSLAGLFTKSKKDTTRGDVGTITPKAGEGIFEDLLKNVDFSQFK